MDKAMKQVDIKERLNKVDNEGGAWVEPVPGFVMKTQFLAGGNKGEKLFINVCSNDLVEKPHVQSMVGEGE